MTELTITEALVKLKLADKKIEQATSSVLVGWVVTNGSKAVPAGFPNVDSVKTEIQKRLDSVQGLVRHRDILKKAVVESNARTPVKVGNQQMTVAEAIETKQSIKHRKALLSKLESELAHHEKSINTINAQLEVKADQYVTNLFQGAVADENQRQQARKNYIEANTAYLLTHDSTRKVAERLRQEIDEFETNVDVALSVANAKTLIQLQD